MCKVKILQVDLCQTQHLRQGPKVITQQEGRNGHLKWLLCLNVGICGRPTQYEGCKKCSVRR